MQISRRATGNIVDGKVYIKEIFSYDVVGVPGFSSANLGDLEFNRRLQRELERKELLKNRKQKLNKLFNEENEI